MLHRLGELRMAPVYPYHDSEDSLSALVVLLGKCGCLGDYIFLDENINEYVVLDETWN